MSKNRQILDVPVVFLNTKGRSLQEFTPLEQGRVKFYSCGPTVYDFPHVGNMFAFTLSDLVRRLFDFLGYEVVQVMNITDVGHLRSDDDIGEDKMAIAVKRWKQKHHQNVKNITVQDIIDFYTSHFVRDLLRLNIRLPHFMPFASHHVGEMIDMIKVLQEKGYAYVTPAAVYYDVTKFTDYTKLYPQALDEKVVQARQEVVIDPTKKHPADFRLWQLDQPNHVMLWDSPWGKGFPGWHIECSAMSIKYLGASFDIHTGGEDHIPVHHTNEIAQSEACTGKEFANYWLHVKLVKVEGQKMSKSKQNFYVLQDLLDKGYAPEHVKLFNVLHHYRTETDFAIQKLDRARDMYKKIVNFYTIAKWQVANRIGGLQDVVSKIKQKLMQEKSAAYAKDATARLKDLVQFASQLLDNIKNTNSAQKLKQLFYEFNQMLEEPHIEQQNVLEYLQYLKDREMPYMQINWPEHKGVQVATAAQAQQDTTNVTPVTFFDIKNFLETYNEGQGVQHIRQMAYLMAQDLGTPRVVSYAMEQFKKLYNKEPLTTLAIVAAFSNLLGVVISPKYTVVDVWILEGSKPGVQRAQKQAHQLDAQKALSYALVRTAARQAKQYDIADLAKNALINAGFQVIDTPEISVV